MFSVNYQNKLELYTKLVDYFLRPTFEKDHCNYLESLETPKNNSVVAQQWR